MCTIFLRPERDAHNVKCEQIYCYPGIRPRNVSGMQTTMKTQFEFNTLAQMTPRPIVPFSDCARLRLHTGGSVN